MKKSSQYKERPLFFYLSLLFILFFGCVGKHEVRVENLDISIPDSWIAPLPASEKMSGDWWSVFEDPVLETFLVRLRFNSPDIKTIVQNQRKALYNAKINGAAIYPSFNMLARADTNVQNLSGFGFAESFMSIQALFIGSILTATSIGITARILKDLGKLDGAEGITILAAAVFDDVFGILVLAIVISLNETQTISSSNILIIAVQAVGIWLAITALSFLLSSPLSKFISGFNTEGALVAIPLGLALICAALAEHFGLAMIIGAYSFGLGMSNSKIKHEIDIVIHLASITDAESSVKNKKKVFDNNFRSFVNIVNFCKKKKIK